MQKPKKMTMATVISVILAFSIVISMVALPTVMGYAAGSQTDIAVQQGMNWPTSSDASATRILLWNRFHDKIPTHVYIMVAPNPVGVGQQFNVVMFNPQVPPSALIANDIRYQFTMQVVKPDNTTETLPASGASSGNLAQGGVINGKFVSDSTGSAYTTYTPNQAGNYTFTVFFQELYYRWNSTTTPSGDSNYFGTTFLASNYTATVVVQNDPVSLIGLPNLEPVPTEYWNRPIEGQNTAWYTVSSNWLGSPHDRDFGGPENRYQSEGTAPNSAHILWTRPTEDNGVVGGNLSRPGNVFNAGSQYQPRFMNQIIMYGRLYYSPNLYTLGASDFLDCVDLRTGELIYRVNTTQAVGQQFQSWSYSISQGLSNYWFGYYYSQDDPNEHGVQNPGWIFTPNYGRSIQPATGIASPININSVPTTGAFEVPGVAGENLRYIFTNLGTSSNPNYYLGQWNSSKVIPMIGAGSDPSSNPINASTPNRYDWNISSPIQFSNTPTIRAARVNDILFGSNGSWPMGSGSPSYAYPDNTTIWAISLAPNSLGQLLYMKTLNIDDAKANTNFIYEHASAEEKVFVALEVPTQKFHVYSMTTGDELFSTDAQSDVNPYGYFTWPSLISVTQTKLAYGMLYTGGYTGMISAYPLNSTGTSVSPLWRYTAPSGGEKIQNYVLMEGVIADGKIYVGTHEHSADTPLYKGERVRALNATTGDVLFTMSGWAYPESMAVADGTLIYWNNYDAQIYALGKGPTSMTLDAPNTAADFGTPVVIRGTVNDISAGTKQKEQAARFPNGVPAVSDESQSQWMEYVYMQKGRPTNTTGVPVTLTVIDQNGNYRQIGQTKSDSMGMFSLTWTPDIEGSYTVVASFGGSESYWPSYAESSFAVSAPHPTTQPPTTVNIPNYDMYFLGSTAAIIIAIAIVAVLVLRKH